MNNKLNREMRTILFIVFHGIFAIISFAICLVDGIKDIWYLLSIYAVYMILNFIYTFIYKLSHDSFVKKTNQFYYANNCNHAVALHYRRYTGVIKGILMLIAQFVFFPAVSIFIPYFITDAEINQADECFAKHKKESIDRADYYYTPYDTVKYDFNGLPYTNNKELRFHCPFEHNEQCNAYICCYLCHHIAITDNEYRMFNNFGY